MAASTSTSQVYIQVIEDVMNKVREEFVNNGGPGEDVLKELQATWETKMIQASVILGPIERSAVGKPTPGGPITPVHDLNVLPYEGTEEYETPTAEMLFPPTPLQTPIQTPLPGTADNSIPTGSNDYPTPANDSVGNAEAKGGRPSHYMQSPSPWTAHRPPLDVNIAYVEGREEVDKGSSHMQDFLTMNSGKRKRDGTASQNNGSRYIPQQDGAGDGTSEVFEIEMYGGVSSAGEHGKVIATKGKMLVNASKPSLKISQLDGPIPYEDDVLSTPNIYNYGGVFNEDYNVANTPAPEVPASTPAPATQNDVGDVGEDDDDEPPLNENDDDDLDDVDQGEDQNTHHLVLAQFDKVTRTKSRWKCTLKDGIMHINNKDVLFNKATGEFDF